MVQDDSSDRTPDPGAVALHTAAFDPTTTRAASVDSAIATRRMIPPRYQIREDERGRFLTCVEAPNVAVRLERGFSVSSTMARKFPEHTVFLDGAAQSEPFLDTTRRVYNLDHHEGCVRAFTLATCEQAMVLVCKGLDLEAEKWTVYGNDPDLDTVLAAWVLLNHRRLAADDSEVRRRATPLIRLQGVIDAHGFELADLSGFPDAVQEATLGQIEALRRDEVHLKAEGSWSSADPLDYTLGVLLAVDDQIYRATDFGDGPPIDELERVPLTGDRFAIMCRADVGIYELESELREIHGDRIGLILLEREPGTWTVRQTDPFLPLGLTGLFDRLNLVDPAVTGNDRWGGSNDIGGSPRAAGTGLTVSSLASVVRWVFRPPGTTERLRVLATTLGLAAAVVLAAVAATVPGLDGIRPTGLVAATDARSVGIFTAAFAVAAGGVLAIAGRSSPRLFGLRWPRFGAWMTIAGAVVLAAFVGGGWGVVSLHGTIPRPSEVGLWYALVLWLGGFAAEVLFRGAVHGRLARVYRVMPPGGSRFLSLPTVVSAIASAVATLMLFGPTPALGLLSPDLVSLVWGASALLAGVSCGLIRERSGSVWASAVVHGTAMVVAWALLLAL